MAEGKRQAVNRKKEKERKVVPTILAECAEDLRNNGAVIVNRGHIPGSTCGNSPSGRRRRRGGDGCRQGQIGNIPVVYANAVVVALPQT